MSGQGRDLTWQALWASAPSPSMHPASTCPPNERRPKHWRCHSKRRQRLGKHQFLAPLTTEKLQRNGEPRALREQAAATRRKALLRLHARKHRRPPPLHGSRQPLQQLRRREQAKTRRALEGVSTSTTKPSSSTTLLLTLRTQHPRRQNSPSPTRRHSTRRRRPLRHRPLDRASNPCRLRHQRAPWRQRLHQLQLHHPRHLRGSDWGEDAAGVEREFVQWYASPGP